MVVFDRRFELDIIKHLAVNGAVMLPLKHNEIVEVPCILAFLACGAHCAVPPVFLPPLRRFAVALSHFVVVLLGGCCNVTLGLGYSPRQVLIDVEVCPLLVLRGLSRRVGLCEQGKVGHLVSGSCRYNVTVS